MPRPTQDTTSADRYTYIPQAAQQAMARQTQQSLPAHLKQYAGDHAGYIPQHAQKELAAFMQKSMPAHLQQYAGAYVQQNFVDPGINAAPTMRAGSVAPPPPPALKRLNQSHSGHVPGEQPNARFLNLFQPDAAPGKPSQPMAAAPGEVYGPSPQTPVINVPGQDPYPAPPVQPAAPEQQPPVEHSPYEFIMNPGKPAKAPSPIAGGSALKRAMIFGGGLVVLLILFVIFSSILKEGGGNTAPLMGVLQEQTELSRVAKAGATTATQEKTKALALNVQLSVASADKQLSTYMSGNHDKINTKLLGIKHSAAVDTQLQAAQANDTYDTTLVSVLQNDLASYSQALQAAYRADPGPRGQAILSDQYDGAQLLLTQSKQ